LIGHVKRTDSKRKSIKVFSNNPQATRLRGRQKNRWWKCVQIDINKCSIKNWKGRLKTGKGDQETEPTGKSPLTL